MTKKITLKNLSKEPGCLAEYDSNSMSIDSAKTMIRSFIKPIKKSESINLIDSINRVLAIDLISPINVPNYDNSAMDGFGFKLSSLKNTKTLNVKNKVLAGNLTTNNIKNGEAIKIMTGAKIPSGVDTVIPIELVNCKKNQITFIETPKLVQISEKLEKILEKKILFLKKDL